MAVTSEETYTASSKDENVVTEYVNEEDGKLKKIIWTKGITPHQMGGKDIDYKKEITNVGNYGKVKYIEYKSPYIPGPVSYTHLIPKPLVKVKGMRMIDTVIQGLQENGISEIYIVVGYLKEPVSYTHIDVYKRQA